MSFYEFEVWFDITLISQRPVYSSRNTSSRTTLFAYDKLKTFTLLRLVNVKESSARDARNRRWIEHLYQPSTRRGPRPCPRYGIKWPSKPTSDPFMLKSNASKWFLISSCEQPKPVIQILKNLAWDAIRIQSHTYLLQERSCHQRSLNSWTHPMCALASSSKAINIWPLLRCKKPPVKRGIWVARQHR